MTWRLPGKEPRWAQAAGTKEVARSRSRSDPCFVNRAVGQIESRALKYGILAIWKSKELRWVVPLGPDCPDSLLNEAEAL
jgi:hypothetical protein